MASKHISAGNGMLCGSVSLTAFQNTSDCRKCNQRMEDVLLLLMDAAEGMDIQSQAKHMLKFFGLERISK